MPPPDDLYKLSKQILDNSDKYPLNDVLSMIEKLNKYQAKLKSESELQPAWLVDTINQLNKLTPQAKAIQDGLSGVMLGDETQLEKEWQTEQVLPRWQQQQQPSQQEKPPRLLHSFKILGAEQGDGKSASPFQWEVEAGALKKISHNGPDYNSLKETDRATHIKELERMLLAYVVGRDKSEAGKPITITGVNVNSCAILVELCKIHKLEPDCKVEIPALNNEMKDFVESIASDEFKSYSNDLKSDINDALTENSNPSQPSIIETDVHSPHAHLTAENLSAHDRLSGGYQGIFEMDDDFDAFAVKHPSDGSQSSAQTIYQALPQKISWPFVPARPEGASQYQVLSIQLQGSGDGYINIDDFPKFDPSAHGYSPIPIPPGKPVSGKAGNQGYEAFQDPLQRTSAPISAANHSFGYGGFTPASTTLTREKMQTFKTAAAAAKQSPTVETSQTMFVVKKQ